MIIDPYSYPAAGGGDGLLTDLISYWKLDEASGDAIDAHGSNDLTDNNSVGSDTGLVYGTARDFESSNTEYFSIPSNASLVSGDIDITLAAWVKLESVGASRAIMYKGNGAVSEYELYYSTSLDRFAMYVENGGSNIYVSDTTILSVGTWYFVVGWHDATANTLNIQVNDGTVASTSYSGGIASTAHPFYIGSEAGSALWDGLIGPATLAKGIYTAEQRTLLYNSGAGLPYSSYS